MSFKTIFETTYSDGADTKNWLVIDAAAVTDLPSKLEHHLPASRWCCLFDGAWSVALKDVAPYLIELECNVANDWNAWLNSGWGKEWGIYFVTDQQQSLLKLKRHFRRWTSVYGPDAESLLFRWYDPRVLKSVLLNLTAEQLQFMFKEFRALIFDDHNSNGWQYQWHGDCLHIQHFSQSTAFTSKAIAPYVPD